jgi:hypothetical protein
MGELVGIRQRLEPLGVLGGGGGLRARGIGRPNPHVPTVPATGAQKGIRGRTAPCNRPLRGKRHSQPRTTQTTNGSNR